MSQKPSYRIAVYPGDGIGREVTPLAFDVLNQAIDGQIELDCTEFPWGVDYYLEHGSPTPPDYIDQLRPFDAIYLGAVGAPGQMPDPVSLEPPVRIRQAFDQYACLRPALLLDGVQSPLAGMEPRAIDLLVVRENSEGEYVNQGGRFRRGEPDEIAVQSAIHTRAGVTRILRFALEQARARRRHLTMVTKSNAQKYSFVLWEEVLEELIPEYPDVRTDRLYVDAAAMDLVRRPRDFDVIVSSNLFGDILSDLAAMVVGGLGMAPSANIRPDRGAPSMFEPVHGSAPDIAGKGDRQPRGRDPERGHDDRVARARRAGRAHARRVRAGAGRRRRDAGHRRRAVERAVRGAGDRATGRLSGQRAWPASWSACAPSWPRRAVWRGWTR